jgi:hypothetical protein
MMSAAGQRQRSRNQQECFQHAVIVSCVTRGNQPDRTRTQFWRMTATSPGYSTGPTNYPDHSCLTNCPDSRLTLTALRDSRYDSLPYQALALGENVEAYERARMTDAQRRGTRPSATRRGRRAGKVRPERLTNAPPGRCAPPYGLTSHIRAIDNVTCQADCLRFPSSARYQRGTAQRKVRNAAPVCSVYYLVAVPAISPTRHLLY